MPLDPEIQKFMHQQRMQNWIGSLAQGFMQAAAGGRGAGAGVLQAFAGANTGKGSGPLDMMRMQAQLEQLTAGKEERARAEEQRIAAERLMSTPEVRSMFPSRTGVEAGPPSVGGGGFMRDAFAADPEATLKYVLDRQLKANKMPSTRQVTSGEETLEQIFSPDHPDADEFGMVTTHKGPRYKPGVDVDLGGVVGEMGAMLTEAGASKRAVDLEDRRVATTQMAAQGAGLIQALNEGGDSAISWTGGTARGLGKLSSQGRALAKQVGFDLNLKKFTFGGDLATKSSGIKSRLLGLAVGLTKADQGSRPSDFDVQTSLDRLAASSGSSRTMAATIQTMLDEKMSDFAIDYRVRSGEDFDWNAELDRHGIAFPEIPAEPEAVSDVTPEQATEELRRRGLIP